jgi:hypothetical protein
LQHARHRRRHYAQRRARERAERGGRERLEQELHGDMPARCTEGTTQAHLVPPF